MIEKKLCGVMIFAFLFSFMAGISSYAQSATARKNGNNDIVFKYTETPGNVNHSYQAIGLDVTMIDQNGAQKHETIRIPFDETLTQKDFNESHTEIYVTKIIPSSIMETFLGTDMYADYEKGESYFIIDAVNAVTKNTTDETGEPETHVSASIVVDPFERKANTIPNTEYPDYELVLAQDPDKDMAFGRGESSQMLNVYDFPYVPDIKSMYSIFLWMNDYDKPYEETSRPDRDAAVSSINEKFGETIEIGNGVGGAPEFYTYNDSRAYQDEEGVMHEPFTDEGEKGMVIPSGERYVNGINVDSTCGTVDIGLRGAVHTWNFKFKYSYRILSYKEDGTPYIAVRDSDVSVPISRRAYYLYIRNLDLYDFESAEVENNSSEQVPVYYYGTDKHLAGVTIPPNNRGPVEEADLSWYLMDTYGETYGTEGALALSRMDRPEYEARISTTGNSEILNGQTFKVTSFVPNDDNHISWAPIKTDRDLGEVGFLAPSSGGGDGSSASTRARNLAYEEASNAVGNGDDILTDSTDGERDSFATVKNDYLRIGYNNFEILNGAEKEVLFGGTGYSYEDDFNRNELPPYLTGVLKTNIVSGKEVYETSPAFDKDLIQIPVTKENGDYFTGIKVTYKQILPHLEDNEELIKSKAKATERDNTGAGYDAIAEAYYPNEPVRIHTPVISPVSIRRDDGDQPGTPLTFVATIDETQLTDNKAFNADVLDIMQLKLDGTYWFTFDDMTHIAVQKYRSAEDDFDPNDDDDEEEDDDYDQYTKAKYVHFPFDVVLYGADDMPHYYRHSEKYPTLSSEDETDGTELTKKDEDGGQYWIMLNNDQWKEAKFYIPPWATEDVYNTSQDGHQIIYRVDAQNVVSDEEDHRDDEEEESNTEVENYIAVYPVDVQLSGWMYDFTILGTNCADIFYDNQELPGQWYSFYQNQEEKKAGTLNRFGTGDVRSMLSGSLYEGTWDNRNTIALANGKSNKYPGMGMLPLGSAFTFSLKTISNLWGDDDYISIAPKFTFIKPDGTRYELSHDRAANESGNQFWMYYDDYSGEKKELFKVFGADEDSNELKLNLIHPGLGGAAVNAKDLSDPSVSFFQFTAADPEIKRKVVELNYTGSNDVLFRINKDTDPDTFAGACSILRSKQTSVGTHESLKLGKQLRIYNGSPEKMMQNTDRPAGNLIPLSSLVPVPEEDENAATRDDAETEERRAKNLLTASMQEWYGIYEIPDNLRITTKSPEEILAIAGTPEGLQDNNSIFEQTGYLVLNFDIVSVKGGEADLRYKGAAIGMDMWATQKEEEEFEVKGTDGQTLVLRSGDVAVYDISRKITDGLTSGNTILR